MCDGMWKSEENLQKSTLTYHVGFGDWTQIIWLSSQYLHQFNHLAGHKQASPWHFVHVCHYTLAHSPPPCSGWSLPSLARFQALPSWCVHSLTNSPAHFLLSWRSNPGLPIFGRHALPRRFKIQNSHENSLPLLYHYGKTLWVTNKGKTGRDSKDSEQNVFPTPKIFNYFVKRVLIATGSKYSKNNNKNQTEQGKTTRKHFKARNKGLCRQTFLNLKKARCGGPGLES